MENKPMAFDLKTLFTVLKKMTPAQRREWVIKIKMSEARKTYDEMARRHHLSKWLIASAVSGRTSWSPRVIAVLETELKMDLTPFLTSKEADKVDRA